MYQGGVTESGWDRGRERGSQRGDPPGKSIAAGRFDAARTSPMELVAQRCQRRKAGA